MSAFREGLLEGKTAFIAGGTSGINLGIAQRYASLGARVAVAGRDAGKAAAAAATLGQGGLGLSCDVRDYAAARTALEQARDHFGPFDIVVSGAAGNFMAPALGMSSNGFRTVVDIDLNGTFNVFRASHDLLNLPGASLIAISAIQAVNPTINQAHVCAAKAGVNQLVRVLAMEWGAWGVRVNAISPGPIANTEGMARLTPTPEAEEALSSRIALRRFGKVSDIAECAVFLASASAAYVTGAILDCDGGASLGDSRDRTPQQGLA